MSNSWVKYVHFFREKNPQLSYKESLNKAKESYYKYKKQFKINNLDRFLQGIDRIYWINLDRSLDRKKNMEFFLKDLSISNERIVASDGLNDPNILSNFVLKDGITQKTNIYACMLSHLRAIQTFWESGLETALILEDDTSLSFMKYWNDDIKNILSNAPQNWEILMMSYSLGRRASTDPLAKESERINEKDFIKQWYIPWKHGMVSTAAYIINRNGAEKIMKLYRNGMWYIDILPHVSDYVIYKLTNTYTYKYAYFTGLNEYSTLHNQDLQKHINSTNFSKKMWIQKQKNDKEKICA
jgi:GR25 family glycosyltransferase involved in LPS biosynthesis